MPTRAASRKPSLAPPRSTLLQARKEYSKCAKALERGISTSGLTPGLSEGIIGVGIALDWVRRAAEMEQITYIGENLNSSEHRQRFTEFIRFGFAWFGLNAIFSRPSLLTQVGTPSGPSEFARFRVLFDAGPIPDAATIEAELRALLDTPTTPRLPRPPGMPSGTSVTTLRAIHLKYVPAGTHHGACAAALASAANSGSAAALDLPTMLYGFRNWSVHGNALDGCFGSHPRYVRYVQLLTTVLAEVHLNTAQVLRVACEPPINPRAPPGSAWRGRHLDPLPEAPSSTGLRGASGELLRAPR